MQVMTEASRQLFSRPADEHFASQSDYMADAVRSMETGQEIICKELIVIGREPDDPAGPFSIQLDTGQTVVPNHYSLQQLCSLARIPIGALQRISPKTGAQALNESLRHDAKGTGALVLLERESDGTDRVRSITSEGYSRVWDAEWIREVDRWLFPQGYIAAVPTINTDADRRNIFGNSKPALFRGDRDSFAFYYTEPDPAGQDFGGLRRGAMFWNSEVGHRSIGYATILFRDICANFLIWDAQAIQKRRRVHRGDMRPFFLEMRAAMQDLSRELEPVELQRLERSIQTAFAGDGSPTDANKERARRRLTREFRLTRQLAIDAVEATALPVNATELPLSYWSVANAVTWEAKDTKFASHVMELGQVQRDILQAVPV